MIKRPLQYEIDPNGCHICTSHLSRNVGGYARISINGKVTPLHRVMYEKHKGKIPRGMCVCHKCDNPECINPDHLFLGTQRDNVLDMIKKGRDNHARGEKHHRAKLTANKVLEIQKSGKSYNWLAAKYNISKTTIWRIKKKITWKHILIGG